MSLCKRRGFLFQSSEIYGGMSSVWDYGPLGTELKRNIKDNWWRHFVWQRDDIVGLDSSILMHPEVWRASGHVGNFSDPLVECKNCHKRYREDGLDTDHCPDCDGEFTPPRMFNLMFKTFVGPLEDEADIAYLRPETAQGIFVNFDNVLTATRRKLPFGIAQVGKAFRNEITTGSFIFRTREFEIMELEFFVQPEEADDWHQRWIDESLKWYTGLGITPERLRLRSHEADELAHYSTATSDIEYLFPWAWGEVNGIANRTDYDLKAHSSATGEQLTYFNPESEEHIFPYVIEPTFGVDRTVLCLLIDAYTEEEAPTASGKNEKRVLLKLHPSVAPVKVAVLPLSRNERLVPLAREVYEQIRASNTIDGLVQYDDAQSIGRRYRRQDEIGTLLCVTVDFDSLDDNAVTIRERDSMAQTRVPISELAAKLKQSIYL